MNNLSLRLKTIASLVPKGARVCDVGTDHAYLPIFLSKNGIAKGVVATDLNEKPLKNAQKNITQANANGITLIHCDGLSGISSFEADTIIIAGMGGEVISGILERCDWVKSKKHTFIFQPTTSPEILRQYLCENGFAIKQEIPVFENKKLYSVMLVKYENLEKEYSKDYYYIGKVSPQTQEGFLYISKQQKRIFECMKGLEIDSLEHKAQQEIYKNIEKLLTEK